MSDVLSDALVTTPGVINTITSSCAALPSDSGTAINESLAGYFIASRDGTNFIAIDPRNVSTALEDGFCVCYVDEPLLGYSAFTDTVTAEDDVVVHPQPIFVKDASTELIILDHAVPVSEELPQNGGTVSVADQFHLTEEPSAQLSLHSEGQTAPTEVPAFKLKSKSENLQCVVCHTVLPNKSRLKRHMRTHENEKPHSCTQCDVSFNHMENLLIHTTLVHSSADQLSTPYSCPLCDLRVSRYAAFRSHVSLHRIEEQLLCEVCHRFYPTQSLLQAHKEHEHAGSSTDVRYLHRYRCHLCQTLLYSLGNLTKHYRTCHPNEMKCSRSTAVESAVVSVPMTDMTTTVPVIANDLSSASENVSGRGMRASKLRAKAYLASLKNRICKPRQNQEDMCKLMIGYVQSSEPDQCQSVQTSTPSYTNVSRKRNPRVCQICGKRFSKPCLVQRHMIRHTLNKPFECLVCHARFARKSTARTHLLTHSSASTYFCPLCCREYSRRGNLILHLARMHSNIAVEFVSHNQEPQQKHQTSVPENLPLERSGCESMNYSQIIYTYPSTTDNPSPTSSTKVLPTSVCHVEPNVSFPLTHSSYPEPCEIIELGSEFVGKSEKSRRPFLCSVCEKAFASSRTLSVHLLRHSSAPLPYECSHCPRRFATRSHQRYHVNSCHTHNVSRKSRTEILEQRCALEPNAMNWGPVKWDAIERRFKRTTRQIYGLHACSQCPRRYRNLSHLRAHVRQQHKTSLAPFACALCRRRFVTAVALDRHKLRGHTRGANSQCVCPICELSFVNSSSMKRHMAVHSNDRPYRCAWCLKSFKFHSSCLKHMKTQVCRSRLLVHSGRSIILTDVEKKIMNNACMTTENYLSSNPSCSEAIHLACLMANSQPPIPTVSSSDQTGDFWPNFTTTTMEDTESNNLNCASAKVNPAHYPMFSSSADQIQQDPLEKFEPSRFVQPSPDPSHVLAWNSAATLPIMIDPTSTDQANEFLMESVPTLVESSATYSCTIPSDKDMSRLMTAVPPDSNNAHGYTTLLMDSELTRDSFPIANPLDTQRPWSYLTDVQSVTAQTGYDPLAQTGDFPQLSVARNPCVNMGSTTFVDDVIDNTASKTGEISVVHLQQTDFTVSESTNLKAISQQKPLHSAQCESDQNPSSECANTSLLVAKKKISQNPLFGCTFCNASFKDAHTLLVHSHTFHANVEKRFTCSSCDTMFSSGPLLTAHKRTHTNADSESLSCPVCPSTAFSNQSGLTRHINSCHPEPDSQRFKCSRCGLRFFQLRQLRNHISGSLCSIAVEVIQATSKVKKRRMRSSRVQPLKPKDVWYIAQTESSDQMTLSEHYLIKAAKEAVLRSDRQSIQTQTDTVSESPKPGTELIQKSYLCSLCPRSFRLASDLKRHMCRHTGSRPYKCGRCDKQYLKHCQLRRHEQRIHGDSISKNTEPSDIRQLRYVCHICSRCFTEKFNLLQHMRLHTSRGQFKCSYRSRRFASIAHKNFCSKTCSQTDAINLVSHAKDASSFNRNRTSLLDELHSESNLTKVVTCSQPEAVNVPSSRSFPPTDPTEVQVVDLDEFPMGSNVPVQVDSRCVNQDLLPISSPSTSTMWYESTEQMNSYGMGMEQAGKTISRQDEETEWLSTSSASTIPVHQNRPLDSKNIGQFIELTRCTTCGKDFSNRSTYDKHTCLNRVIDQHKLSIEPNASPTESRRPKRASNLLQALYKCTQCDRIFSHLGTLHRHESTHLSKRTYLCDTCGTTFTKQSSLTAHERIHMGTKPFRCSHCAMEFRQKSNMRRHIKLVHS